MDALLTGLSVAIVGALATFVAWISPRVTKKGRLLIELHKLGDVRANLPLTAEVARFDEHIDTRVRAHNEWLDPINRRSRLIQNAVSTATATFGTILVYALLPAFSDAWLRSAVAAGVLTVVILLGVAGMLGIERWATRTARARKERLERVNSLTRTASALGVKRG